MNLLDKRLPLIQNAPLEGKIVLVRFDHNVVKKGQIRDPYRIDMTLGTLYNIVERGGRPILMTHVGRPKDKKTGKPEIRPPEGIRHPGIQIGVIRRRRVIRHHGGAFVSVIVVYYRGVGIALP